VRFGRRTGRRIRALKRSVRDEICVLAAALACYFVFEFTPEDREAYQGDFHRILDLLHHWWNTPRTRRRIKHEELLRAFNILDERRQDVLIIAEALKHRPSMNRGLFLGMMELADRERSNDSWCRQADVEQDCGGNAP